MIKSKIISMIPNQNREFLSHSKNYITATLVTKGIGFLLILIITKILPTGKYGSVSIFCFIVSVLTIASIIILSYVFYCLLFIGTSICGGVPVNIIRMKNVKR